MFHIPGYQLIRRDRLQVSSNVDCTGGGLLIYLHDSLNFEEIDFSSQFIGSLELCIVKILVPHMKPLYVTCIYNPPSNSLNTFVNFFGDLVPYLTQTDRDFIIEV